MIVLASEYCYGCSPLFLVEQHVCFCVGYVLELWVDVTLHFLDMALQHLHLGVPHGMELPFAGLLNISTIGVVDSGGLGYCFSFALTIFLARLSVLLRLRHGLGTFPFSSSWGSIIFFSDLVSKSGVYFILKNVLYVGLSSFLFVLRISSLF